MWWEMSCGRVKEIRELRISLTGHSDFEGTPLLQNAVWNSEQM